ncbi:MAG: hypothetical protein ACI8RZ_004065 [Myxococcota bacterium]
MTGTVLALLLGITNVILALAVFVLLARPERAMGWLSTLSGMREVWLSGRLSEKDEARLLALASRLRLPLLALLFGWSFFCGAILTWARL